MAIKIEKMNLNHLNELQEILISDFDDFWSFSTLKEEVENENSSYIIGKINNEIIGFAGLKKIFDQADKLGFEKLGVRKKYYNNNNGIIMKKNLK